MVRMWAPAGRVAVIQHCCQVDDLPLPVAPTIRISPRFSVASSDSIGGTPSSSSDGAVQADITDHHCHCTALAKYVDGKLPTSRIGNRSSSP